jgi:hypothetical protein
VDAKWNRFQASGHWLLPKYIHMWPEKALEQSSSQEVVGHDLMKKQPPTKTVADDESIRRSRGEAKAAEDESRFGMMKAAVKRGKWEKAKKPCSKKQQIKEHKETMKTGRMFIFEQSAVTEGNLGWAKLCDSSAS